VLWVYTSFIVKPVPASDGLKKLKPEVLQNDTSQLLCRSIIKETSRSFWTDDVLRFDSKKKKIVKWVKPFTTN
jgi:hypothetical protein